VFLIDDVGAELDPQHTQLFFGMLSDLEVQVLATSTSAPADMTSLTTGRVTMFHVEQGRVVRQ
jgi:recombinational DNA repair ATPase RecF